MYLIEMYFLSVALRSGTGGNVFKNTKNLAEIRRFNVKNFFDLQVLK